MKVFSDLTYKIVAFGELKQVDSNECIDWALEMIELGYESPTLFMLASFNKPTNHFEIIGYLKDTMNELGFRMKVGIDACLSYCSYYIQKISDGYEVRENLKELYKLYSHGGFEDVENVIEEFRMLHWAWEDVDYEGDEYELSHDHNYYWDGANASNIERISVEVAKKWIDHYKDNLIPLSFN